MGDFYQHPNALIDDGASVGAGTRVWAFAHIVKGAVIGKDLRMTFSSDLALRSRMILILAAKNIRLRILRQFIKQGCSIGASATVLPGIVIGQWSMMGAGSVVTRSVPNYALVVGNPACPKGWICRCGSLLSMDQNGILRCTCGRLFRLRAEQQTEHIIHGDRTL
jgi:UDP-2-acetamido-3-amino-2,3-dideoxy-glucuronate N-acetyltransferase